MNQRSVVFVVLSSILIFSCSKKIVKPHTLNNEKIKFDYKDHIVLKGFINDSIKGNFGFDTGVYGFCLDSIHFLKLKIKKPNFEPLQIRGVGENHTEANRFTDTVSFKIGRKTYKQKGTPVFDLKKLAGNKIDGICGYSIFEKKVIQIDYEKRVIECLENFSSDKLNDFNKVPIKIRNWELIAPLNLKINDSINLYGDFVIDTGNPYTIDLTNFSEIMYDVTSKVSKKNEYYTKSLGLGGYSSGTFFKAENISFNDYTINNKIISVSKDRSGALGHRNETLGILGNKFFENFIVIIDFPNQIMYLKPSKKYYSPKKNTTKYFLGFSFSDRTIIDYYWIVNGFTKKSNAEISGLQIGDKIIEINNVPVNRINEEKFRNKSEKQILSLKLKIIRNGILQELAFKTNYLDL